MKTAIRSLFAFASLWLLALSGASQITNTNPVSKLPVVTTLQPHDYLHVSRTNPGTGKFLDRRIAIENFNASTPKDGTLQTRNLGILQPGSAYWAGRQAQAYDDAFTFFEPWHSSRAWSGGLSLSNRAVYGASSAPQGMNHAFTVGATNCARIIGTITIPATNGANGLAMVGVNSDPPGSVVASADNSIGIGIRWTDGLGYQGCAWNKGAMIQDVLSTNIPPGTYQVEITVDAHAVGLAVIYGGHTNHTFYRVERTNALHNLWLWNSDTRGASGGMSIGPLGARLSTATLPASFGLEGKTDFWSWTFDDSGTNGLCLWFPPNYDSRIPTPLVVVCHGSGGNEHWIWFGESLSGEPQRSYFQGLVDAGFIVLSTSMSGAAPWGNQASVDALDLAIRYAREHYSISTVSLLGASMGGLTALNFIAQHKSPITSFYGLYPVANLASMWTNSTFSNYIKAAYAIAEDGSDYATKTSGYDPALHNPALYYSVPMRMCASPDDAVVPRSLNSLQFSNLVADFVPESTVVSTSGDHGDASNYAAQVPDVVAFFQRHGNAATSNLVSGLTRTNTIADPVTSEQPPLQSSSLVFSNGLCAGRWTPAMLNPTVWLTASSYPTNTTSVTNLMDSGIYGHTFVDGNGLGAPYVLNSIGGKPAVYLGTTNRFVTASILANKKDVTFFGVIKTTNGTPANTIWGSLSGNLELMILTNRLQLVKGQTSVICTSTNSIPDNTPVGVVAIYDGNGAYALWINGVPDVTGTNNVSLGAATGSYIGVDSGISGWFGGFLSEVGKLECVINPSDVVKLNNYFADEYGLGTPSFTLNGNLRVGTNGLTLSQNGNVNLSGLFWSQHTSVGATNDTQEITVGQCTVPGGAIGSNGTVRVTLVFESAVAIAMTNLTARVYYGATQVASVTAVQSAAGQRISWQMREIYNAGNQSSQVSYPATTTTFGTSGAVVPRASFNTATNFVLSITMQNTGLTQTNWLTAAKVEILSKD